MKTQKTKKEYQKEEEDFEEESNDLEERLATIGITLEEFDKLTVDEIKNMVWCDNIKNSLKESKGYVNELKRMNLDL